MSDAVLEILFIYDKVAYVKSSSYPDGSVEYFEKKKAFDAAEGKYRDIRNIYTLSTDEISELKEKLYNTLKELINSSPVHLRLLVPEEDIYDLIDEDGRFYDKRFKFKELEDRKMLKSLLDTPDFIPTDLEIFDNDYKGRTFICSTQIMKDNKNVKGYSLGVDLNPLKLKVDLINDVFSLNYINFTINGENYLAIMDITRYPGLKSSLNSKDKKITDTFLNKYKNIHIKILKAYKYYMNIIKMLDELMLQKKR